LYSKIDKYFRAGPQAILNDSYWTISILVAGNIIDAAEQAECLISGFSSFLHRY
jgi:hypothetical protein